MEMNDTREDVPVQSSVYSEVTDRPGMPAPGTIYRNSSYDFSIVVPSGWSVIEQNKSFTEKNPKFALDVRRSKHEWIRATEGVIKATVLRERWLELERHRHRSEHRSALPVDESDSLPTGTVTIYPEEMYNSDSVSEQDACITITSAAVTWTTLDEAIKEFVGNPIVDFLLGVVLGEGWLPFTQGRFGFYRLRHQARSYNHLITPNIYLSSGLKVAYLEFVPQRTPPFKHIGLLALVGQRIYLLQALAQVRPGTREERMRAQELWAILDTFAVPGDPPRPGDERRKFRKSRAIRLVQKWLSSRGRDPNASWENGLFSYELHDVEWTEAYRGEGVWEVTAAADLKSLTNRSAWDTDHYRWWWVEESVEGHPSRRYHRERKLVASGGSSGPTEHHRVVVAQWHVFEDTLAVNPILLEEYPELFFEIVDKCY